MSWETVIGLEVHVQLKTRTKMFCACSTAFGDPPNTHVCPVCLGLPGALPRPNQGAVRLAVRAALALGCTVHRTSVFARKNYFYPDLPKGYQISQFERPLATNGQLSIGDKSIGITRLHLEEDAGKSLHDRFPQATAVDFNRCGVPLIEIVTEPDLRSPEEARRYLVALKQVLEYLEVSDCNMEEGSLRVDANLSVRRPGDPLGTKQEVKNMNSFAAVERALGKLRDQQIAALEAWQRDPQWKGGDSPISLTTFTARTGDLTPMRVKEESHDYRYFPEPDLPPLDLTWYDIDPEIERATLPELPAAKAARFATDYGLPAYDAGVLSATRSIADYFEAVVKAGVDGKEAANWVMGPVLQDANENAGVFRVPPQRLAALVQLVRQAAVSLQAAKQVFSVIASSNEDPQAAVERLGLLQVGDQDQLRTWIDSVLQAHPEERRRYQAGETKLLAFFMGQVMRASRGKADPKAAQELLRLTLDQK
ncbi:MAG TPA: Asp-tRNA(Asn)/Glu-tRNA(Gln) amidotransferase subunit GatB [Gemmatimonadales bacterium]|nr:Asp-tRNA(Asn)/Glu-tRNA(Gln) amidotransferase subunit GatB [Gemmatimonadales bacterium]